MEALIPTLELVRREEARMALVMTEVADEHRPFGGGVMARGAAGAWFNTAVGCGLAGPVDASEVDGLIRFYEDRSIEPRVELSPFADQSLIDALGEHGFVLRRFEVILARPIASAEHFAPPYPTPHGLKMVEVDRADDAAVEEFARISLSGFLPEGVAPNAELMEASMRVARHPRSVAILAMVDGRCVGAGAMEFHEDLATLYGVSVVTDMRRKGIQLAMMAWRLRHAAKRGATVATIGSLPGASTETNAMRMGFRMGYCKVVVSRPGEGLAPVVVG